MNFFISGLQQHVTCVGLEDRAHISARHVTGIFATVAMPPGLHRRQWPHRLLFGLLHTPIRWFRVLREEGDIRLRFPLVSVRRVMNFFISGLQQHVTCVGLEDRAHISARHVTGIFATVVMPSVPQVATP